MRPDRPRPTACLRGRSCPEGWVQERRSPERSGLFSGRRSEQPDDGRIGDGSELGKLRGQVARRTAQVRHRLAGVDAEQRPISGISWPSPRAPFGDSARMEPRPLIDQRDEIAGRNLPQDQRRRPPDRPCRLPRHPRPSAGRPRCQGSGWTSRPAYPHPHRKRFSHNRYYWKHAYGRAEDSISRQARCRSPKAPSSS